MVGYEERKKRNGRYDEECQIGGRKKETPNQNAEQEDVNEY